MRVPGEQIARLYASGVYVCLSVCLGDVYLCMAMYGE
jgi:hypothetical protein